MSNDYQKYGQIKKLNFDLNFDLKSGFNTMRFLGVTIGAALAMWWNPVGWLAITATVGTLLFSFVKSIWGLFDSDYKKEQQRKNVNNNLLKIKDEIKTETKKSLFELTQKMRENEQKILTDLNDVVKPISFLNQDLNKAIRSLNDISNHIV